MVSLHISVVAHVERPLKIKIMDQILQSNVLTKWFVVTTCVLFSEIELIQAARNGVFGSKEEPHPPSVTSLSSTSVLLSSDTFSTILSSTEGINEEEVGLKTLPQLSIQQEQMSQSPDWSQTVSNLSSPLTSVTSSPQTYISTKSDTPGHNLPPTSDTRKGDAMNPSDFKVFGSKEKPPSPSVTSLSSTSVLLSSDIFSTILSSTEGINVEEVGPKTLPQLSIHQDRMSQSPDWSQTDKCKVPTCPTHGRWTMSSYSSTDRNCPANRMVTSGFRLTYTCNTGYFKCQQRELVCNDGQWKPSAQNLCLPLGCRNLNLHDPLLPARYTYNGKTKCFNASYQQNGTVIQYSCKHGFKLLGRDPRQATCIGDSWEPQQTPRCVEEPCSVTDLGHYEVDIQYMVPSVSENATEGYKPSGTIAYLSCRKHGFDSLKKTCERGKWEGEELECVKTTDSCQLSSSQESFNEPGLLFFDIPNGATTIDFKVKANKSAQIVLSPSTSKNGRYYVSFRRNRNTQYTVKLCWKTCAPNYRNCPSCSARVFEITADESSKPEKFIPFWVSFKTSKIEVGTDYEDLHTDLMLNYSRTTFKYLGYPQNSLHNVWFCNFVYDSSSSASVISSSATSYRSTFSTESIPGEEMVRELGDVTVWLLAAAVVVNTTTLLAVSICAIVKRKRAARCEQTAEHGSVNERRAENNSSLLQMETNLCSHSMGTTEGDKNDIMVDNVVYESAVDTPIPSEENGGKSSSTTRNEQAPIYECIV